MTYRDQVIISVVARAVNMSRSSYMSGTITAVFAMVNISFYSVQLTLLIDLIALQQRDWSKLYCYSNINTVPLGSAHIFIDRNVASQFLMNEHSYTVCHKFHHLSKKPQKLITNILKK